MIRRIALLTLFASVLFAQAPPALPKGDLLWHSGAPGATVEDSVDMDRTPDRDSTR